MFGPPAQDTAKKLQSFSKNPEAMRGWLQTQALWGPPKKGSFLQARGPDSRL